MAEAVGEEYIGETGNIITEGGDTQSANPWPYDKNA